MSTQLRTYRNAVVLITGGASGIGAAWSKSLASRGAKVIIADRQEPEAGALARTLGNGAEAVSLDVRDAAAFESVVSGVFERHGRLDYLFNNAGLGVSGEAKDYTLEDWRLVVEVNLMGVIHGVHAAYPRMIRQGFGHIVNTASMAGHIAMPMAGSYGTTKYAVVGLSRNLRVEAKHYGVRVSAVCPGVIRTPLLQNGKFGYSKLAISMPKQMEMFELLRPMDPDIFAAKSLRAVAANQPVIIVPSWWRMIQWLNRLAPDLADALVYQAFVKTKTELEAAAAENPPKNSLPL